VVLGVVVVTVVGTVVVVVVLGCVVVGFVGVVVVVLAHDTARMSANAKTSKTDASVFLCRIFFINYSFLNILHLKLFFIL
jgi:hypothetical protein